MLLFKLFGCFKEQRYKIFESNSQLSSVCKPVVEVVSKSKDTRFLKAIHNYLSLSHALRLVVSKSKDTRFLKAIHNRLEAGQRQLGSCFKEQRYKIFESNSQLANHSLAPLKKLFQRAKIQDFWKQFTTPLCTVAMSFGVVSKSKDTRFLKAIHN